MVSVVMTKPSRFSIRSRFLIPAILSRRFRSSSDSCSLLNNNHKRRKETSPKMLILTPSTSSILIDADCTCGDNTAADVIKHLGRPLSCSSKLRWLASRLLSINEASSSLWVAIRVSTFEVLFLTLLRACTGITRFTTKLLLAVSTDAAKASKKLSALRQTPAPAKATRQLLPQIQQEGRSSGRSLLEERRYCQDMLCWLLHPLCNNSPQDTLSIAGQDN